MTFSFPGCSSSGRKPRPSAGATPSRLKKFADTRAPPTRSGSFPPLRLHFQGLSAATPLNDVVALRHSRKACTVAGRLNLIAAFGNHDLRAVELVRRGIGQRLHEYTYCTTLTMAALAPIPNASVAIATTENPESLVSVLRAYRTSAAIVSNQATLFIR